MITIYTNPTCGPCRSLIKAADRFNIAYETKPAAEHTDYLEALGYTQAPVVVSDSGEHFSGFRPDQLKRLAAH
jgi:glutaredoxin-like protein NrdH